MSTRCIPCGTETRRIRFDTFEYDYCDTCKHEIIFGYPKNAQPKTVEESPVFDQRYGVWKHTYRVRHKVWDEEFEVIKHLYATDEIEVRRIKTGAIYKYPAEEFEIVLL